MKARKGRLNQLVSANEGEGATNDEDTWMEGHTFGTMDPCELHMVFGQVRRPRKEEKRRRKARWIAGTRH